MTKTLRNTTRTGLAVAVLAALAGCGSCETPAPPTPVEIAEFKATPNPAAVGGDVVLAWRLTGDVESVTIQLGEQTLFTGAEPEGSFTVHAMPSGQTKFVLVAMGGGVQRTAETTVTAVSTPTVVRFAADRLAVPAGAAVVLSWETRLADTVKVSDGATDLGQATGAQAAAGSLLVRPAATTEYALAATGAGGSATAKLTVQVLPAPVIATATATPAQIVAGQTTTLAWTTANATRLTVSADGHALFSAAEGAVASGSHGFQPAADVVYKLVAVGPGGEAAREVSVEVTPVARVTRFVAEPPDLVVGSTLTLRWAFSGVATVALTANGQPVTLPEGGDGPNGSTTLQPTETTTYRVTGTGAGGEAHAELTVPVYGMPEVVSFASDVTSIYRRRDPATLSWTTRNATHLSIADASGNVVGTAGKPLDQGSVQVSPLADTSYVLTLSGPGGVLHSDPVALSVLEPTPYIHLALARPAIVQGESTELSWVVADHTSFALYKTDLAGNRTQIPLSTHGAEDLLTVSPAATTIYTIEATGPGGESSQSITLNVMREPAFVYARSTKTTATRGTSVKIEWKTTDADAVVMLKPFMYGRTTLPYVSIAGQPGTQEAPPMWSRSTSTSYDDPVDNGYSEIAFPDGFRFPFYGVNYTSARMAVNGYVCFGGDDQCDVYSTDTNQSIPSTTKPNSVIAAFWDDLETQADTRYLWRIDGTAPTRRVTFEWKDTDFYSTSYEGNKLNFQLVLYETGEWEVYNQPRPPPTKNPGSNARWGIYATVGAENPGGTSAQLIGYNTTAPFCWSYVAGTTSPVVLGSCDPIVRVRGYRYAATGDTNVGMPTSTAASTTIELRAFGPLGAVDAAPIPINLVDAPQAQELTATRTHVGAGEQVTLSWRAGPRAADLKRIQVTDGTTDLVDIPEAALQSTAPPSLSQALFVSPTATRTYTLKVTNLAGDVATKTVDIVVSAPTATFTVDRPRGPAGDQFTLSWTSSGATSLGLKGPDDSYVAANFPLGLGDAAAMAQGSVLLRVDASGTYKLEVTNASGTTTLTKSIEIIPDLTLVSFTADRLEQTAEGKVMLRWETWNTTAISIRIDGETESLALPSSADDYRRKGSFEAPVRTTNTTYRFTATKGEETQTATVTVVSVPKPRVLVFAASPTRIDWDSDTTVSWQAADAAVLRLHEMTSVEDGAPNGQEITAARDVLQGSATLHLFKTTRYRLHVENRLGYSVDVELNPWVTVDVSTAPTVTLTATPAAAPKNGFTQLTWTGNQVEKVYLWRRDPPTAASTVDMVQVPYDYQPYNWVEISRTGADITAQLKDDTGTQTFNDGYFFVDFPPGFAPDFFGEKMGKAKISANGIVLLAPAGTSETDQMFKSSSSDFKWASDAAFSNQTGTNLQRAVVAPLWEDLSARVSCTTASSCTTGRPPGRLYYQFVGQAPSRMLVVQWTDWDYYSTSYSPGYYTFQAKIHENGDVEYQYKRLYSPTDPLFPNNSYARVGVDRRWATPSAQGNYFLMIPSGTTSSYRRVIQDGDGWRIYSGAQAASGSVRSFINPSLLRGTAPTQSAMFRAQGINSSGGLAKDAKQLDLKPGVNEILITEFLADPVEGSDAGLQWVELRNTTEPAALVSLEGYTLQTSTFSHTFSGNESIPAGGYLVVAQQNADVPSNLPVFRLPDPSATLLSLPADEIVLRYGSVLIDRVAYDASSGWTIPRGKPVALDMSFGPTTGSAAVNYNPSAVNDVPAAWCAPRATAGNTGTPGTVNPGCYSFEPIPFDPSYRLVDDPSATVVEGMDFYGSNYNVNRQAIVPLGFGFPWFGRTNDSITLSDNGWATFVGAPSTGTSNATALPDAASSSNPVEGIYVFWDDLYGQAARGRVLTRTGGEPGERVFVAYWDSYVFTSSYTGLVSFALVLKENGEMEFHYDKSQQSGSTNVHLGASATVGFEAMADAFGVLHYGKTATSEPGFLPAFDPATQTFPGYALKIVKTP